MNKEALATLAEKKCEMSSGSLRDFCLTHLELFKQKGIVHDPEAYKFTKLSTFMDALEYTPYEPDEVLVDQYINPGFINLIFIDGELKTPKALVEGLKLTSIADSFLSISSEFKNQNPLSNFHHSLLSSGIVIEVEKKTKIEKPIKVLNLVTKSGVIAPTVIIKASAFSEITLMEETFDQSVSHAFIGETYVHVDTGAIVEHVQVAKNETTSFVHTSTNAFVAKDGNYRNVILNLSGKLNRRNLNLELLEGGAHGESFNLYLTNASEHSDINTVIHHKAADTTSSQIAKGILDGESKGIFTGKIHIYPQAQRVASSQLNKNLLLSKKAQAHSQPQLEIFADDVKCSHGSTTGQLSDDELFYFQARGIPADKARTLLAHGFGMEIVLKIHHKTVRSEVEKLVMESLKTKFQLGGAHEHS